MVFKLLFVLEKRPFVFLFSLTIWSRNLHQREKCLENASLKTDETVPTVDFFKIMLRTISIRIFIEMNPKVMED